MIFYDGKAIIEKGNHKILLIKVDGLWALPEDVNVSHVVASLRMQRGGSADAHTWHRRLGHVGIRKVERLVDSGLLPKGASGFKIISCGTCQLSIPSRRPIPRQAERSGDIVVQVDYVPIGHGDVGWKGEVGFYLYCSRTSKIAKAYPVKVASAETAVETLKSYCANVIPFLAEKVNCIQTDSGTQFVTDRWKDECMRNTLMSRTCPVDHLAMNGQVERVVGIVTAKMRTLLEDMSVGKCYWPLALEAAVYLYNRSPNYSLSGKSPLELATGRKPDYSRMRVFGCLAYVQIPKSQRKGKLGHVAWKGIFMGYSTQSPEWLIYDPRSGRVRNAYSVTFDERKKG